MAESYDTQFQALGDLKTFPRKEKRFLARGLRNRELFSELPKPDDNDWLSSHDEKMQSVQAWQKITRNTLPPQRILKKNIYLVPLGDNWGESTVQVNKAGNREAFTTLLRRFAETFFSGFTVKLMAPVKVRQLKCKTRTNNYTNKLQLFIPDIRQYLESKWPTDAFCVVGLTMVDLYPRESWNFVFGQAFPSRGVGVFSFARYDPSFDEDGTVSPTDISPLVLWRSCKVMTHEICHLFCLSHCVYFLCAMNGSNHLEESCHRPLFLCPVCLTKIRTWLKCDLQTRYQAMAEFCSQLDDDNFQGAHVWLENCLQLLD